MASVAANLETIKREIAHSAKLAGRDPADIRLVAVSKTVDLDRVAEATSAGIGDFGENRTVEFLRKHEAFPDARWHFIGTLQTNKVKDVVGKAHLIHSVDSQRLLERIADRAAHLEVIQPVLLQVNISGEETKHGFTEEEVACALDHARWMGHVRVEGLMTMAPAGSADVAREVFAGLCRLRGFLNERLPDSVQLHHLSMGMSGDYGIAIEEGATIVRIGSALFS